MFTVLMSMYRTARSAHRRAVRGRAAFAAAVVGPRVLRILRSEGLDAALHYIQHIHHRPDWRIRTVMRGIDTHDADAGVAWMMRRDPRLGGSCLEQALVHYALDPRCQFTIGVKPDEDASVAAHAWVERGSTPDHAAGFSPLLQRRSTDPQASP